jgi:hypothetical protein
MAVHVVKHAYSPKNTIKMDGRRQVAYPRKNWSSFIVFNGAHELVRNLTPSIVNSQTPAFLHRFSWIPDDELIGALAVEWNFLVGEYSKPDFAPSAIHFTNGGPWFENCRDVDFAELWEREYFLMIGNRKRADIPQLAAVEPMLFGRAPGYQADAPFAL